MSWFSRVWHENWLTILIVATLFVAYLALHSNESEIASVEVFLDSLQQGQPTVIEFYSNT